MDTRVGLKDAAAFRQKEEMSFRRKPAGVVWAPIDGGSLDLLEACARSASKIKIGLGVIDIIVNHVETPDEIAARIDRAVRRLGPGRIQWVHPDCGFWMLKRSVADRKIEALVAGRDLFLARQGTTPSIPKPPA